MMLSCGRSVLQLLLLELLLVMMGVEKVATKKEWFDTGK